MRIQSNRSIEPEDERARKWKSVAENNSSVIRRGGEVSSR